MTAVSADDAWAVGEANTAKGTDHKTLILHRTANRWYVVPAEAPASSVLYGSAVAGGDSAWADGESASKGGIGGLVMRWNGAVWKPVANPLQGLNNAFYAIAASPGGDAWAVGADYNPSLTIRAATSMLWNGKTWRKVPVGPLPTRSILTGAAVVPGGPAWAVGYDGTGEGVRVLILRWTGHGWAQVANPEHGTLSNLIGVTATSPDNAWAVGAEQGQTLILHWNGKTWS